MSVWSWKRGAFVLLAFSVASLAAMLLSVLSFVLREGDRSHFLTPFLSFKGGSYPENGVFSMLLFIVVILGASCVVMRYVFVEDQNRAGMKPVQALNRFSIFSGTSSFVGLLIVAAFPLETKIKMGMNAFHSVGCHAFLALGWLYCCVQTSVTFLCGRCSATFLLRLCLTSLVTAAVCTSISLIEVHRHKITQNCTDSSVPDLRLVAFGAERLFFVFYVLFFVTFVKEFQKISTYLIVRPLVMASSSSEDRISWSVNQRM